MNRRRRNYDRWKEDFQFFIAAIQFIIWIVSCIFFLYSIVLQKGVDFFNLTKLPSIGPLSKSDAIFLTGLASLITVLGVTIFSFQRGKSQNNILWYFFAMVFDLLAIWFYFRYWIGVDWWIYICLLPLALLVLIGLFLLSSKIPTTTYLPNSSTVRSQNFSNDSQTNNMNYQHQLDKSQQTSSKTWDVFWGSNTWDVFRGNIKNVSTKNEFNKPQEPHSDKKISPYTLRSVQNLDKRFDKELPPDVAPLMHDLTRILVKKSIVSSEWDVYKLSGFVNQIKNKKPITLTYFDVLDAYGKDVADEMKF